MTSLSRSLVGSIGNNVRNTVSNFMNRHRLIHFKKINCYQLYASRHFCMKAPDNSPTGGRKNMKQNIPKFMVSLWQYVRSQDFYGAVSLLHKAHDSNVKVQRNVYTGILSLCKTKKQLPVALQLLHELTKAGYKAGEPDYLAIIRCLCDNDGCEDSAHIKPSNVVDEGIKQSLAILYYMQAMNEYPRSRTYMPLLVAMNRERNLVDMLHLLNDMYNKNVTIRRQAVSLLLDTYVKCQLHGDIDPNVMNNLRELLSKCNHRDPTGISGKEMISILLTMKNAYVDKDKFKENVLEIQRLGVLSSNRGAPTEARKVNKNINHLRIHDMLAINNVSYPIPLVFTGVSSDDINNIDASINNGATMSESPMKTQRTDSRRQKKGSDFDISSDIVKKTFDRQVPVHSLGNSNVRTRIPYKNDSEGNKINVSFPREKARIVHISSTRDNENSASGVDGGTCPNCGVKLQNHRLNASQINRIRVALATVVSSTGYYNYAELEKFVSWIQAKNYKYDFIIDGANIAYHKQKELGKGFSYRQLHYVVNQLELRHPEKKILVVLPVSYYSKIMSADSSSFSRAAKGSSLMSTRYLSGHSSSNVNKERIPTVRYNQTKECYDVFKSWIDRDMVYSVPRGIDDDWFWLFASVVSSSNETDGSDGENGESSAAYVVTNDGMRDHKIAFLEPKYFQRWRSTQTIQFDISRPIPDNFPLNKLVWPKLKFWEPGLHSREMQKHEDSHGVNQNRWHIPSTDQNAWLCMDIA